MNWNEWSTEVYWGNSVKLWLTAFGVAVVTVLFVRVLKWVFVRRLKPLAERSDNQVDDAIVGAVEKTRFFFYVAIGVYLGSKTLDLPETPQLWIARITGVMVVLQIALWSQQAAIGAVSVWQERHAPEDSPASKTMGAALGFVSRLVIWSVAVIIALSNVGVEVSALIAGLGVGGVAAALAAQSLLKDAFASFSIYFDRPFDVGDFVIVGEFLGNVDRIGILSTRLRSLGGEQIVMSNSDLAGSRIRNYRRMDERRVLFHLGVVYQTAHEKLKRIPEWIKEAIEEAQNTRFDRVHFNAFGDYALVFEAVYWVCSPDYAEFMERHQEVLLGIHSRFEEQGVSFAYPTQTLHLQQVEPPAEAQK